MLGNFLLSVLALSLRVCPGYSFLGHDTIRPSPVYCASRKSNDWPLRAQCYNHQFSVHSMPVVPASSAVGRFKRVSKSSQSTQLWASNLEENSESNNRRPSAQGQKYVSTKNYDNQPMFTNQKRMPKSKRMALKWVVQGIERSLAEEINLSPRYTYKRRIDASLVDALYLMVNARSQKEILDAGKRIQALMRVGSRQHNLDGMKSTNQFPMDVVERVIKATAMTGLVSLALDLLYAQLRAESDILPSPMAYTAVLNALRKNGRVDQMEELLSELAGACRRIRAASSNSVKIETNSTEQLSSVDGVDIVAFNTYLATLCDAAVNELPYPSQKDYDSDEIDDFSLTFQNFGDSNSSSVQSTTSSEKYLHKAFNLLKNDVAQKRFALAEDVDILSFNTVLVAAAKCSKSSDTGPIIDACMREMKKKGIQGDTFTYNARIRALLDSTLPSNGDVSKLGEISFKELSQGEKDAIQLIDKLLADPNLEPDRFTVNLALVPFLRVGREHEIWEMLTEFYQSSVTSDNKKLVSSAFEAFLNTLVQNGFVDFAREVFEHFFLPNQRQTKRMQLLKKETAEVETSDGHQVGQKTEDNKKISDSIGSMPSSNRMVSLVGAGGATGLPYQTTRHFNILLRGYCAAYQRVGQSRNSRSAFAEKDKNVSATEGNVNATLDFASALDESNELPVEAQKVYKLLENMLENSVPLDSFTVTSLMPFPSTAENITSLWKLIEPEISVDLSPAAYRSIISAYGNAGDASSACWVFEEMGQVCGYRGRNVESWNVILGALGRCANNKSTLDVPNSEAFKRKEHPNSSISEGFISLVNGKTCIDASNAIFESMKNGTILVKDGKHSRLPGPNSQTYCLVATALAASGKSTSNAAVQLFQDALDRGVGTDGRFLNAVLRCFGDDVEGALAAWKNGIGAAAAAARNKFKTRGESKSKKFQMTSKQDANVIAAYNGLLHVCGRANRPDVALRIVYAMVKAGIQPTDTSLNSYNAGKRLATSFNRKLSFMRQYESLLYVECTKYSVKDKRREGDKKIRIIF